MPAPTGSFEFVTFGINRVRVSAYGTYPPVWFEIPIVKDGTLKIAQSKAEVADGEGDLAYTFHHSPRATLNVMAAKSSMRILEMISGNTVSSAAGTERILVGTDNELTPPLVTLDLLCVAVDPAAATPSRVYQQVIVFKATAKFPDVDFKAVSAGEMGIEFDVLKSTKDEQGFTLPGGGGFARIVGGSSSVPA